MFSSNGRKDDEFAGLSNAGDNGPLQSFYNLFPNQNGTNPRPSCPEHRGPSPTYGNGRGHRGRGGHAGSNDFGRGRGNNGGFNNGSYYNNNSPLHGREYGLNCSTVPTAYVSQGNLPESKHLTGPENYAQWSLVMKAILMAEGTWAAVTGTDNSPDKNDRAFSKLCLNVSSEVASILYGCTTAKHVWDKLASTYSDHRQEL